MSNTNSERTLDYTRIVGRGVDALDRRKEHNSNERVTAEKLRNSINTVKAQIFDGLKMLSAAASKRVQK